MKVHNKKQEQKIKAKKGTFVKAKCKLGRTKKTKVM